jgi:hypothetical protein
MKPGKLPTHLDARGSRGIFSRGTAHYGVSRAPVPGKIKNVQEAAKRRLNKQRKINAS